MSWGIVATVGSAIVGAGASIYGANQQANAIDNATDAQAAAEAERLKLLREQYENAQNLLQPSVDRGNQADAYLDALLYGKGTLPGGGAGGPPKLSDYLKPDTNGQARTDALAKYQADFAKWAQANGINAAPPSLGMFGTDDNPQQRAERIAQYEQSLAAWRQQNPGTAGSGTVSREDVMRQIEQNPLYQYAQDDYDNRLTEADRAWWDEANMSTQERDQGLDRAQDFYTRDQNLATRERNDANRLAGDLYHKRGDNANDARKLAYGTADSNFEAEYGLAKTMDKRRNEDMKAARTGLRTVADTAYTGRMGEVDSDYAKRQDLTRGAVSAWEAKARAGADKAVDTATSRFGVTGQLGDATNRVAQIEEEFGRDRALYEAERNDADWDWRSGQSFATRDARDDVYLAAEDGYNNDRRAATDAYATDRTNSLYRRGNAYTTADTAYSEDQRTRTDQYGADRGRASDIYYDRSDAANQRNADSVYGFDEDYYDALTQARRDRNNARSGAYDTFAGNRATAYGDYVSSLGQRSDRGYSATTGQASAGQTFAQNAGDSYRASADAYAQGQYGRANVYDTLAGDLSGAAGDIVGAITNKPKKKTQTRAAIYSASAPRVGI